MHTACCSSVEQPTCHYHTVDSLCPHNPASSDYIYTVLKYEYSGNWCLNLSSFVLSFLIHIMHTDIYIYNRERERERERDFNLFSPNYAGWCRRYMCSFLCVKKMFSLHTVRLKSVQAYESSLCYITHKWELEYFEYPGIAPVISSNPSYWNFCKSVQAVLMVSQTSNPRLFIQNWYIFHACISNIFRLEFTRFTQRKTNTTRIPSSMSDLITVKYSLVESWRPQVSL